MMNFRTKSYSTLLHPLEVHSYIPWVPSRLAACFLNSLRIKSPASGVKILGVGNFPRNILSFVTCFPWLEWKGDLPVNRSKVKIPNDHQSAGLPYPPLRNITSGAMYSTKK